MSVACIPATRAPSSTAEEPPMEFSPLVRALFSIPTKGFTTHMNAPMKRRPTTG